MMISRRALIKIALGTGAALATGVAACSVPGTNKTVAATGPAKYEPVAAAGAARSAKYQPGPEDPGLRGPGDMIMKHEKGRWHTHLLPFANPRAGKAAVVAELKSARAQRLLA